MNLSAINMSRTPMASALVIKMVYWQNLGMLTFGNSTPLRSDTQLGVPFEHVRVTKQQVHPAMR